MNTFNQLHKMKQQMEGTTEAQSTIFETFTRAPQITTTLPLPLPSTTEVMQSTKGAPHCEVLMDAVAATITTTKTARASTISASTLNAPLAEATIIDIPATIGNTSVLASLSPSPSPPSSASASSSASSSSSSYDTDCSTASSTCCTRHGEHIYMERTIVLQQQQQHHHHQHQHHPARMIATDALSTTATTTIASTSKYTYRKSWPIFILLISIIEISIFVYDQLTYKRRPLELPSSLHISTNSVFIYRPDRRLQIWRFISYMFLHANWFHLGFNIVIQLFYGIPLEVMHGSARVGIIYLAGVFAGSLGTSVVDSDVYLVGASGGVYALLAAHLANIMLNYAQMKYAVAQLVSVIIFVFCDLGYAFYTQYMGIIEATKAAPPVSYIAHLTGALAGLTIGLLVLKNFEQRAYDNVIWWLALGVYSAFTIFAIVFNLINTVTAQAMEEQGEVITQHLLHDLGVS